jgi:hypothetical protein
MNKFTGCFYVNSPRSIGCEEKVKEAKKKKRQSTILGGQKKKKRKKIVKDVLFSTFLKAATPTKLQQKRRPWSMQHKVIDLEKS